MKLVTVTDRHGRPAVYGSRIRRPEPERMAQGYLVSYSGPESEAGSYTAGSQICDSLGEALDLADELRAQGWEVSEPRLTEYRDAP